MSYRSTILRDEDWEDAKTQALGFIRATPADDGVWVLIDDSVELHNTASIAREARDRGAWVLTESRLVRDETQLLETIGPWWGE